MASQDRSYAFFKDAISRYAESDALHSSGARSVGQRRLSPARKKAAFDFYGNACAVCGGTTSVDINHINEDHSDDHFANLMPTCSDLNQAIERGRYVRVPDLAGEAEPDFIKAKAKEHFDCGNYPQSHACSSLASHLYSTRRADSTRAIECCVFSFTALRPMGRIDLLLDTLAHCVYLFSTAKPRIAPFWRAEVLSQVGLALYDFGRPKESLECELAALRLYDSGMISDHPEAREVRRAKGLKRLALSYGPFLDGRQKRVAFGALRESKRSAERLKDNQGYVSASWVEATLEASLGHRAKALDIAERSLDLAAKTDKWTVVGLYIEAARQHQFAGAKKKAIGNYQKARALCEKHRILPIPLPADGSLIILDLSQQLRSLGLIEVPGIARRGENPFTPDVMSELFKSISGR